MALFEKLRTVFTGQTKSAKTRKKRLRLKKETCRYCYGRGKQMEFVDDGMGVSYVSGSAVGGGGYEWITCPDCGGKGYHVRYPSTPSYDQHLSDGEEDRGRSEDQCDKYNGTGTHRNDQQEK